MSHYPVAWAYQDDAGDCAYLSTPAGAPPILIMMGNRLDDTEAPVTGVTLPPEEITRLRRALSLLEAPAPTT